MALRVRFTHWRKGNETQLTRRHFRFGGHDYDRMRRWQLLRGSRSTCPALRRGRLCARPRLCLDRRILRPARLALGLGSRRMATSPAFRPNLGIASLDPLRQSLAIPQWPLALSPDRFLFLLVLGPEAYALPQLATIVRAPRGHDLRDFADVVNIGSAFAGLDRAELGIELHRARGIDGCRLDRLERRHPGQASIIH